MLDLALDRTHRCERRDDPCSSPASRDRGINGLSRPRMAYHFAILHDFSDTRNHLEIARRALVPERLVDRAPSRGVVARFGSLHALRQQLAAARYFLGTTSCQQPHMPVAVLAPGHQRQPQTPLLRSQCRRA